MLCLIISCQPFSCLLLKVAHHLRTNTTIITQFAFLWLLHDTLIRYEQINESSSSVNISTSNYVETIIRANDDDFFPKCDTLSIRTQTANKVREKKETKFKDATIRNTFTQTVSVIISNTISTQKVPHPCNCLE